MASFDNTGYPPVHLKEKYYRVLESREGSLLAITKILYGQETEMPPTRKIYKLVLKYESQHNSRISIGSWEEIFQQLGCLEEFKGIMKKFNHLGSEELNASAANDNRSSGNSGYLNKKPVHNDGDSDGQTLQAKSVEIRNLQDKVKALQQKLEISGIFHKQENERLCEQVKKLEQDLKTIKEENSNLCELLQKSRDEVKTMKEENNNLHVLLQKSQDEVKAKKLEETKVRDQQRKLEQQFDKHLETLNFELTKQQKELQQLHQQLVDERDHYQNSIVKWEMELIRRDNLLQEKEKQLREKWRQIACNVVKGETLGRGAWGNVFKGTLSVAVKELLYVTPERLTHFEREMEVAFVCHHPNIVQFLGASSNPACPKIVMELMATNLRDFIKMNFKLPQKDIIRIAGHVANGLLYLHSHDPPIIHRDIKPDNILLKDGIAKIGDLGSAKFHHHNMTPNRGTVKYAAPEVQNGNNNQTPKMDVWSYGLVVLEMATGLRPEPNMPFQQIELIQCPKLKELVRACTNFNATQRFSMKDVISFLAKEFTVNPS